MRLIVDMIAARVPISDLESTPTTVTRTILATRYADASRTSRRVAVPKKGILGKTCGYATCFKKKEEVDSHSEVNAR